MVQENGYQVRYVAYVAMEMSLPVVHVAGCSFKEMWDEEDPDNQERPMFCELLESHVPPPFHLAFSNSAYRVLQVANSNHSTAS